MVSLEKPQLSSVIQHWSKAVVQRHKQVSECLISAPQHCLGFLVRSSSCTVACPGTGALGCLCEVTGPASSALQHPPA